MPDATPQRRGRTACASLAICAALVTTALIACTQPTAAATRKCGDFVAAAGEDRTSEITAKQKAMAEWIQRATKLGPAFAAWRLAIDKSLSCLKLPDGTHRCQAMARPCGISQAPSAQPPGTVPQVPAAPKKEQRI
jgi:hypothetical protein